MGDIKRIIEYIKQFICYGDAKAAEQIGYTADESLWPKFTVVIVPNGHLGKDIVYPSMKSLKPRVLEQTARRKHKTYIIDEDIIYAAFFFISRAEELINTERDEHGRFAARFSILGKRNRMSIPLIDEYSRTVCKLLDKELPKRGFDHIYLTHDIDVLTQYRHLRGALGGFYRGEKDAVLDSWRDIRLDPAYTFPWLIKQDRQVPQAETIYFIKHTHGRGLDYPQYCLHSKDWQRTKTLLLNNGAQLGLHSSYYGSLPTVPDKLHRSHYLRCSIAQMAKLAQAGITDDFTMGFADQAGFRLQTTRAVRWINPKTYELTALTLHPLTVMDCTLSNSNYMNLTEDEAYYYCQHLIDKTRLYHGDLCLLWHNSNPTANPWFKSLYSQLINMLK